MAAKEMSWLDTLKMRIERVIPATTHPTYKAVFGEWLQLCDKIELEQSQELERYRNETSRLYQDRWARKEALLKLGNHADDCAAVKVIGRFGSRAGLHWSDGDAKTCSCGFREGLQIHESGERTRDYEELFNRAQVEAIAHGYAATIGGTQFGRTRTDEEDEEDSRRNLERVIEEVKEKR